MEKSKTLQIRLSEEDYHKIKFAFKEENLSAIVREFLIQKAESKIFDSGDMSLQLQGDIELQRFIDLLSHPTVQKTLFDVFKKAKEV